MECVIFFEKACNRLVFLIEYIHGKRNQFLREVILMNNEEKILSMLEGLVGSVAELKEDVAELKEDVAELREDVAELREESAITRDALNQLLDNWAARFGPLEEISVAAY